jgi:hypothetical protein
MPARFDGGSLKGGAPRAVWLTGEHDPRVVSARSVAQDLANEDRAAHLVWDPTNGDLIQMLPLTRAALLLAGETGREGRVCAQIMVIGRAREPFTGSRLEGLATIMKWLDAWGVARRWPAGPPLPCPQSYHSLRDSRAWSRGGHFGHSQVPGEPVGDPGAIEIRKITGPDTPAAEIPRPRPPSGRQITRQTAPGAPLRAPSHPFEPSPNGPQQPKPVVHAAP